MTHKRDGVTSYTLYCFLLVVVTVIYIKQQAEYAMMFMNKCQHSY